MPGPGIQEEFLRTQLLHEGNILHRQADRLGIPILQQPGFMRTVRRLEPEIRHPEVSGESHDAPAAVATHHAAGTVRVVVLHRKSPVTATRSQQHHPVGPEAEVAVAQTADLAGIQQDASVPVVGQQEIVAGAMVLIKLHATTWLTIEFPHGSGRGS